MKNKVKIIGKLEKDLERFSKYIENKLKSYNDNLNNILEVIGKIEESWSNSWIGYHADLYYGNFQRPPINARFDSNNGLTYGHQQGWNEKTFENVVDFINKYYSGPSLEKINDNILKIDKESLHTEICSNLSFIKNLDNFDKEIELLGEIEDIIWEIPSKKFTDNRVPKNFITSDTTALSQGLRVAPHIRCESKILSSAYMIKAIEDFIKKSNKLLKLVKVRIPNEENKTYQPINETKNHHERKSQIYKALALLIPSIIAVNVIKPYFPGYELLFFHITVILAITIILLLFYFGYLWFSDK